MKFQVEWQIKVLDDFDNLKDVKKQSPFEIEVHRSNLAREAAEEKASRLTINQQAGQESRDIFVPEIIALIDEDGVRHQSQKS